MTMHAKPLNQLATELQLGAQMRKTQEQPATPQTPVAKNKNNPFHELQAILDEIKDMQGRARQQASDMEVRCCARASKVEPASPPASKVEPTSFAKSALGGGFAGHRATKIMKSNEPFYMDSTLGTRHQPNMRVMLNKSANNVHLYSGFASRTGIEAEDYSDH